MTDGWLKHNALQIIKGTGKTPTDTLSAEPDPVAVNLLSGLITLTQDGWSPNIPALESGGVWVDSPITDGRQLLAASVGNVTEKMTILISDSAYLNVVRALSGLNKMVADCRDFWQTNGQIDPVYLMWWASCAPGPQYALLSNIELAADYLDAIQPSVRVSLSLEREPYWRGLPPGVNPKLWTFYVNAQQIGTNKDLSDATLISNSDHLITQAVSNKTEWSPTALGLQNTYLSQNFIDIPAGFIPGDAPALVEIAIQDTGAASLFNAYVALSTRKQSGVNHAGLTKANSYILAAGDGDVVNGAAKTVGVVGTGEHSNGSAVSYTFVRKALLAADTAYTTYLGWGNTPTILNLDRHFYAGQFAVFLRAKGATDDTTQMARVTFIETDNVSNNQVQFTDIPIRFGSASTVYYPSYVGTITLPLGSREAISLQGYGTKINEGVNYLTITVELKNSSGAGRTVDILDLVLLPLDNFLFQAVNTFGLNHVLIDNTGYLAHGRNEPVVMAYGSNNGSYSIGNTTEYRGQVPFLYPKIAQRLHFLLTSQSGGAAIDSSAPNDAATIRLNIVPRWSGIRDA